MLLNACVTLLKSAYHQVKALYYAGSRFFCPCCSRSFRAFLAFGVHPRPHALCPYCGSLERHRLLWLYLRQKTGFFKDQLVVLDIGPMEFFRNACKRMQNLTYVSADLTDPAADIKLNVQQLPFADDSFDSIICYHVLEHVCDDRVALTELYRVLKPGGWAIIQSPVEQARAATLEDPSVTSKKERKIVFGQEDHLRIYGRDYAERLAGAGFSVNIDAFVRMIPADMVKRFGLDPDEFLYICGKQ